MAGSALAAAAAVSRRSPERRGDTREHQLSRQRRVHVPRAARAARFLMALAALYRAEIRAGAEVGLVGADARRAGADVARHVSRRRGVGAAVARCAALVEVYIDHPVDVERALPDAGIIRVDSCRVAA